MAANRILKETLEVFKFAKEGFHYNLQVLPDVITSSSILFAILFQSLPMATLAGSLVSVTFIHYFLSSFLSKLLPGMIQAPSDSDVCSGRFPGVSYEQLLGLSSIVKLVTGNNWPSYYSTFIGFLAGWIGTLPYIYANEIAASPKKASAVTGGLVILAILCITVMVYRITANCEGFASTSIGLIAGFFIGLIFVLSISWLTERRATNMLGFPLIRSKAADGKPIYVCERPKTED